MKFMEKKVIANVIKNGENIGSTWIVCHGNASYRVWFRGETYGDTPVNTWFRSEQAAAEYALDLAKRMPAVLLRRATVEVA